MAQQNLKHYISTTNPMKTITGKVIKAFRQHLGYKQEFVAHQTNIDVKTLSSIENGRVGLAIENLYLLSKVFGVAPRVILQLILEIYDTGDDIWLHNAVKAIKPLPKDNEGF